MCYEGSTSLYYISLYQGWEIDDQYRNTNMNDKDHLVGQLTNSNVTNLSLTVLIRNNPFSGQMIDTLINQYFAFEIACIGDGDDA